MRTSFIRTMLTSAVVFGTGLMTGLAPAAAQQELNSVEVLVNDAPISSHDINQRLRLVIAISGGVSSEDEFNRVREQVVQAMIDEHLQLQEAAEFELIIPQEELDGMFGRRAQGVGQSPEQFEQALAGIGASKKTMQRQMEAEVAWSELVNGRLGNFVNVAEDEVDGFINRMKSNKGKYEYLVSEIALLVNNPSQEAAIKASATELVARLRDGANFMQVAQQLSASPTAAAGGTLGWISEDDLSDAQRNAILGLNAGQVSEPIRTAGGYQILALRDRRRILTADPVDDQLDLRQLFLSPASALDAAKLEKFTTGHAAILAEPIVQCDTIDRYVEMTGSEGDPQIGVLRIRGMPTELRPELMSLQTGQMTQIFDMEDGKRALIACSRTKAEVQEPNPDMVRNQLEQQRLAMMGRRYLRDLRRKAIIDYR